MKGKLLYSVPGKTTLVNVSDIIDVLREDYEMSQQCKMPEDEECDEEDCEGCKYQVKFSDYIDIHYKGGKIRK